MLTALAFATLPSPATEPRLAAWMVFWNPDSPAAFEARAARIREILPEWTYVDADGSARRRSAKDAADRRRMLAVARRNKVAVYGMASNFADGGFDPARVARFLATEDGRRAHARDLTRIAVEDGIDGIDLDYESLREADRDAFSDFVATLGEALRKARKRLSVTVHPKESEPGTWDGPRAQDLRRIGAAADVVRVMAYDYSWAESEPGPVSPNDWAERVMRFCATQVPVAKLEMAIAGYGYDFATKPARSLTWASFAKLPEPQALDPVASEWTRGKAWFAGAPSMRAKLAIARRLGLRGATLWYLGSEEPGFWATP